MKKIILIFFILSLFIPSMSHAVQGDCSYHLGIDCSAGPDWDGSVICNDGWKDSIDSYSDAIECQLKKYSCTTKQLDDLYVKYKLQEKIDALNKIGNQMEELLPEITIGNSRGDSLRELEKNARKAILLKEESSAISSEWDRINEIINTECESLGKENHRKEQQELQDLRLKQKQTEIDKELNFSKGLLNILTCSYIKNAIYENGECICGLGYSFNNDKTACLLMCPVNSSKAGNTCICNDGYMMRENKCITYTESCKKSYGDNTYGIKTSDGGSLCYCNFGYVWSGNKTTCVEKKIKIIQHSSGTLISTANTMGVYLIDNGIKRPIKSAKIFLAKGYKWGDVIEITQEEMDSYSLGEEVTLDGEKKNSNVSGEQKNIGTLADGILAKARGTSGVYLIYNNKKRPIKSAGIFLGRGYKWKDVVDVEHSVLDAYSLGESVTISETITIEDKNTSDND